MSILLFVIHHWQALLIVALVIAACVIPATSAAAIAFLRSNWQAVVGIALLWFGSIYFEHIGAQRQAQADAKTIAAKDAALRATAIQLRAAGAALQAQDAANAKRIADANQAVKDANAAKHDADAAANRMATQIAGFPAKLAKARQNPTCAALLSADRMKVCGL